MDQVLGNGHFVKFVLRIINLCEVSKITDALKMSTTKKCLKGVAWCWSGLAILTG